MCGLSPGIGQPEEGQWGQIRHCVECLWTSGQEGTDFSPLWRIVIIGSAEALPIIGSAEALPILCVRYIRWKRERERERYRERRKWRHHCSAKIGDEFTLILAKNSHNWRWAYTFPCQKFAKIGDEFTLTLAKNSHNWRWAYTFPCQKFALFVSPFTLPVSPFTERPKGHHCRAEIRNEFIHTFHCQIFFALFVPPLSNGTSRATSDRKPKTNDQILPVLFCSSHRKSESN